MELPRGIRLNNPGNIRHGTNTFWVGETTQQPDPSFVQFSAPVYGLRALMKILKTYFVAYHLNTIREIISRYAPATENNTDAYIADVAKRAGIGADDSIADIKEIVIPLAEVISFHENGPPPEDTPAYWLDQAIYQQAMELAFK